MGFHSIPEVIDDFRLERYPGAATSSLRLFGKTLYYGLRPVLHRSIRERIQRLQLTGWRDHSFPSWPVDLSVENVYERLLAFVLKATGIERIPFIWFWPDGKESCVVMTHDVESAAGRDCCDDLMDIDDSYEIKASFQVVPQGKYKVPPAFLSAIRDRGFEIAVQDLNHDGRLYDDEREFARRARLINQYVKDYGATGFRSAVLYRKPEWYGAFDFSYDMSIPNTARLDPQRGGCCTVLPYFIGNILEIPTTMTQDYMLYQLIGERSIGLWKQQVGLIASKNGLMNFIVHPDYVIWGGVRDLYTKLLAYLTELRATKKIWMALPSEVDTWWRARSELKLVYIENEWRVKGYGAERASVAYARLADGKLRYEVHDHASGHRVLP